MSGHSKWHNIQAKKGKADKARSNTFTKLARLISVAAQQGGGDQVMNFSLRLAVEKAKASNMPKENIERAIKKGIGELDDGLTLQEVMYEGFGPNGVAFLVECLTDNVNRTVSEVKNIFSKYGGSMGGPGTVKWQFHRLGVIHLGESKKEKVEVKKDEFEMALIEAGADDIIFNDFDIEIRTSVENFQKVLEAVEKFGVEADEFGLEWVAKETIALDEEKSEKVANLCEYFEDLDDVRAVYTNEA
ncbi:MAG TPA: YebC/PmpR family DNA-binding transcriptional regulator [Candidatus Magasanikbacteria bacterium]|nr:YebC/PmpR family DNA-binding transcriptional regulator [Candidatus Magasanikbacteria bacterium]